MNQQIYIYIHISTIYIYTYTHTHIYTHTHTLPLAIPSNTSSHPSRSSQSTKLSSLCYIAACHWLFYTCECIYANAILPVRLTLPSAPCSHICSLGLHLYSCSANRLICTIFLDFICMHMKYAIYISTYINIYATIYISIIYISCCYYIHMQYLFFSIWLTSLSFTPISTSFECTNI